MIRKAVQTVITVPALAWLQFDLTMTTRVTGQDEVWAMEEEEGRYKGAIRAKQNSFSRLFSQCHEIQRKVQS